MIGSKKNNTKGIHPMVGVSTTILTEVVNIITLRDRLRPTEKLKIKSPTTLKVWYCQCSENLNYWVEIVINIVNINLYYALFIYVKHFESLQFSNNLTHIAYNIINDIMSNYYIILYKINDFLKNVIYFKSMGVSIRKQLPWRDYTINYNSLVTAYRVKLLSSLSKKLSTLNKIVINSTWNRNTSKANIVMTYARR